MGGATPRIVNITPRIISVRQSSKGAAGFIVDIVSMKWFELESCRLRHWGIIAESSKFPGCRRSTLST